MKNRFNLNEEEKKHIRGLHNINEQEVPTDSLGNPIEPNPLLKKSEEEEILAFGEAFLFKPGGKIYVTLRTRTRIHGLTLIAGARCSSDSY